MTDGAVELSTLPSPSDNKDNKICRWGYRAQKEVFLGPVASVWTLLPASDEDHLPGFHRFAKTCEGSSLHDENGWQLPGVVLAPLLSEEAAAVATGANYELEKCTYCNGKGYVSRQTILRHSRRQTCPQCDGSKWLSKTKERVNASQVYSALELKDPTLLSSVWCSIIHTLRAAGKTTGDFIFDAKDTSKLFLSCQRGKINRLQFEKDDVVDLPLPWLPSFSKLSRDQKRVAEAVVRALLEDAACGKLFVKNEDHSLRAGTPASLVLAFKRRDQTSDNWEQLRIDVDRGLGLGTLKEAVDNVQHSYELAGFPCDAVAREQALARMHQGGMLHAIVEHYRQKKVHIVNPETKHVKLLPDNGMEACVCPMSFNPDDPPSDLNDHSKLKPAGCAKASSAWNAKRRRFESVEVKTVKTCEDAPVVAPAPVARVAPVEPVEEPVARVAPVEPVEEPADRATPEESGVDPADRAAPVEPFARAVHGTFADAQPRPAPPRRRLRKAHALIAAGGVAALGFAAMAALAAARRRKRKS
jgi:hypothetical protein